MALATPIVNLFTMANVGVMSRKTLLAGTRPFHRKIRFFKKVHMQETKLETFTIQKQHVKTQITTHPSIYQHFYLDMNWLEEFPMVENI